MNQQQWIEESIAKHSSNLLRYVYTIVKSEELAKDIVQDTFIKLCQCEYGSIAEDKVGHWLIKVCKNRALEIIRREKRVVEYNVVHENSEEMTEAESPDQTLEKKDLHKYINRAIVKLPERDQQLIRLKYQSNLSYQEIAELTDLKVSHVGYILHHAIKKIKSIIYKENEY